MTGGLLPLGRDAVHVVVDMQRLFAEDTGWRVPSLPEVVPAIQRLVAHRPERVLFTRFVTPPNLATVRGSWRRYYQHWPQVTQDRLAPGMLDLVAPFEAAPDRLVDKEGFSAFSSPALESRLRNLVAGTLVLSGVETDVCVLATALEAVERGLRVVVAIDAVTSFSPAGHRAALDHILPRYEHLIDLAGTADIIAAWS